MEKLILIDGNSLINRAYYATPPLSTKSGEPTNAVYAFINMLVKLTNDLKPNYMLVAFDRHEPTFRHLQYKEYKGTRKPMPDDLRPQIPLLKKVLDVANISRYEKSGFEADDIIGTLAKKFNLQTFIITGDKDSFQLVDESTTVLFTKRGISETEEYSEENFKDKMGINPIQIIDLKACMGDSSDNIPGINGIGEKTALTLIQTYGSVENLYFHTDELKGKLAEKVIGGKESAFLSKKLATIDSKMDIPLELKDLVYKFPFNIDVKKLFVELEFKGLLKRSEIFEDNNEPSVDFKIDIKKVTDSDVFKTLLNEKELTIVLQDDIILYCGRETEYHIKIKKDFFDEGFAYDEALYILKPYLEDKNKKYVFYSYKTFAHSLEEYQISVNCSYDDVDVLHYLADFSGKEEKLFEVIEDYSFNKDNPAYSLKLLRDKFVNTLKENDMLSLYYDLELPLTKVLFNMEKAGFKVDVDALNKVGEKYERELDTLLKQIQEMAGEPLNPKSTKQLGAVLFDKLNLQKGKKTKTGYSTGAEVLEELYDKHPIVPLIIRYREIQKLYSTYIEGFKPLIEKKTGLVHTCFNQTLTQTGRLSSKEPNLQNIPVRDDEGKELRKLFIARDDNHILIDADYSQIELRLLAHFSGCKPLIDAYNKGQDIHALTASQVFNVPLSEVTEKMRRNAKAVNFGIIYGISEFGLSKNLKISPKTAGEYIKKYFETYTSVKEYMDSNVAFCREHGYVSTLLKRKRFIKEINSPNYNLRSFGERAAMNMPLQGSSADIIKIAMINVSNRLKKENLQSKLIMQVHDELIIDALISEKEIVKKILVEEMNGAVKLKVPLSAEAGEGKTWFDAK